jgi:hypothetical protein
MRQPFDATPGIEVAIHAKPSLKSSNGGPSEFCDSAI